MTYFSKQFTSPVALPDGTFAHNASEIEAFLKKSGLACASDYSKAYLKKQKHAQNQAFKKELFKAFLTQYKRMIFK